MSQASEESGAVRIESSWKRALTDEFGKSYFKDLSEFVRSEYLKQSIYPPPKDVFRAFDLCPFDQVKVVIIGQDPYHGPKQANGLSFAVHEGIRLPPSLQNIFKEIENDIGIVYGKNIESRDKSGESKDDATSQFDTPPSSALPQKSSILTAPSNTPNGDLSRWARQGVLLLNATLTVRAHSPGSHQNKGWEEFTDAAIQALSDQREHLVFMLWGNYAKQKGAFIDKSKHLVLEAAHPSPFSAHNGFFGSKHFSKANAYLREHGQKEIDWN